MNKRFAHTLLCASLLACSSGSFAQAFPTAKPVTIVVPFTAGGAADALAREVAVRMATQLKQSVIVDNKPGAGTTIASATVARAQPDGYTVLFAASSLGVAPSLYKNNVGYDPLKSFSPVSLMASITHVLSVNPQVPARNVGEFIAWAKANPGKVNYASVGAGTTTHLEAELFKSMAGIEMTHVPYKGSSPALVDLVAGNVHAMFDGYSSSAPMAADGRIRILGVTTEKRSKAAPELPTIAEQGVKGFDVMTWMGLLVPAGTPKPVVETLHKAVSDSLQDPATQAKLKTLGFETINMNPNEFAAYLKKDVETWQAFIKSKNITLD
ncbi:Bug family tripartite tricarboxylate transporter substrate binding protein [Pseudacidovorax sp. NFM-22]|uniref:Bug family tripartite tricarboxylate transporter substrate binding protein n=1 Tax=Pseudacidovorax sp. NFM-22 TaxID=2744469 RepID=UPI001F2D11D8|nr:tripartite tricarboxylate transporter substrate binding protein [Pseudacidovorax sp. NFM-22]